MSSDNGNPRRRIPKYLWLKRNVCFWIAIICSLELLRYVTDSFKEASVQATKAAPKQAAPIRTIIIENFSSDEDNDELVEDNFFFFGNKPAWFEVTLAGRWLTFQEELHRIFGAPPFLEDYDDIVHHRHAPADPNILDPRLLEIQTLLAQEEEEGFRKPEPLHKPEPLWKKRFRKPEPAWQFKTRAINLIPFQSRKIRKGLSEDRHFYRIPNV